MPKSVCAVVVTYNRKNLLIRTLNKVLDQTFPIRKLIVVDNASSDGTPQLLRDKGFIVNEPPQPLNELWIEKNILDRGIEFIYIRLPENTGGAGGFHTGIEFALKEGCEWLWLMDDDGYPQRDTLEKLIQYTTIADWISPLVVNENNPKELFTPLNYPTISSNNYLKTVEEAKMAANNGILENIATSFNGVLISRKIIEKIGNVRKDLFLWADDTDLLLRTMLAKFKIVTVIDSLFFHPKNRILQNPKKIMFGLTELRLPEDKKRLYYRIRNRTYIYKKYWKIFGLKTSLKVLVKDFIKYNWYFLFTKKGDLQSLKFFYKTFWEGLKL